MKLHIQRDKIHLFDTTGLNQDTIRTLNLMIVAVMGGMVWTNITSGVAITGYLKELGASDFLYGLLIALNPLANSFQFIASYLLEKWLPREKTFIVTGLIQRLIWIPVALIPFVVPMEMAALRLWIVAVLMILSAGMMPFMNVCFFSMCDSVVPIGIRGRYFSARSMVSIVAGLVMGLVVGYILDAIPGYAGYSAVFLIAGLLGGADICCFFFTKFPPMVKTPQTGSIVRMMRNVFHDKNYMRLVRFGAIWYFAVYLSSPFFVVYMRNRLAMSNTQIILLTQIVSNAFSILMVRRWGRGYDRYGNRPLIILNLVFGIMAPLLWSFVMPGGAIWLIFVIYAISGAQWSAFELGAQNLFMGQASEENKTMYFAVYFIGTQLLGMALSNAVGGWLLDNPFAYWESLNLSFLGYTPTRYHYLFILSSILRTVGAITFLRVREEGAKNVSAVLKDAKRSASRFISHAKG